MSPNAVAQTLTALVDADVRFVVCGGVACILQGVARATRSLDLRVALEDSDLRGLIAVATRLGLTPRVPEPLSALLDPERRRCWVEEKQAVVYSLNAPGGTFSVDVFLRYPLSYANLAAQSDTFELDGRAIQVSSKRHLIAAKRAVQPLAAPICATSKIWRTCSMPNEPMPRRDEVDPLFDGHAERPFSQLTMAERLDWIWQGMVLLNLGHQQREARRGMSTERRRL